MARGNARIAVPKRIGPLYDGRASIFQSKDDPEMGGIAGTPFCRLEDGDCISKPTQFQTNHSKPNQPIPTQPTTGWTGAWHDEKADRLEYLKHAGPEHILAFAPTRSGKGVGLVIPSLLGWEGSAVIFDIKGENWDRTAGYRVAAGHVCFRFAPVEEHSARFNPLAEVRIGTLREVSDAQNIAEMLCRSGKESSHDEHWIKSATSLITGLILHLCYTARRKNRFATLTELSNSLTPLMSDLTMPIDLEGMDEQQVNVAREYFSQVMRTPHVESTSFWHQIGR